MAENSLLENDGTTVKGVTTCKTENGDSLAPSDASSDLTPENYEQGMIPQRSPIDSHDAYLLNLNERTTNGKQPQSSEEVYVSADAQDDERLKQSSVQASPDISRENGKTIDIRSKPDSEKSFGSKTKKRKQAQLDFSGAEGKGPLCLHLKLESKSSSGSTKPSSGCSLSDIEVSADDDIIEIKDDNHFDDSVSDTSSTPKLFVKIPFKQHLSTNGNGVLISRAESFVKAPHSDTSKGQRITFKLKPSVSRTTIIREKNKLARSNPGPIVPLSYQLYDDNLISSPANEAAANEQLAFGYPVKNQPWLFDVTYIMAFLSMFRAVLQIQPLGPADFETGLGFEEEARIEASGSGASSHTSNVSPTMDLLFRKLLALVLNRKKPILKNGQRSALSELKSKYITLGLPSEWRDDSTIKVTRTPVRELPGDIVDDSKLDISVNETIEFEGPSELVNPFHDADFEKFGLAGVKSADDRCIMLRSLVTWCLSESTVIKQYFTDAVNAQDASGERDNHYAARAIIKGFAHTLEAKKELERKFGKKVKSKQSSDDGYPYYFDPTSDPLEHPLAFRLNEFVVGDLGFHVGRFYLVRMADSTSGRVSSLEQMRNSTKDFASVRSSPPSTFALYVEDVHSILTDSLAEFGVEFDKDGNEVKSRTQVEESHHWYCVATACDELQDFLSHLSSKLGIARNSVNSLPVGSICYKPALHMFHYLSSMLPVLREYEQLSASSVGSGRASRRKQIHYGDSVSWDGEHEDFSAGLDDNYSEQDEQDEQDEEYLE
ncbi:hypothetical protein OXX80_009925 [Metschnikowia pulcherrima]